MKTFAMVFFAALALQTCALEAFQIRAVRGDITGYGSGVAVDAREFGYSGSRYILTAAHVVHDASDVVAIVRGKRVRCIIAKIDAENDLALLSASDDLPSVAPLASGIFVAGGSPRAQGICYDVAQSGEIEITLQHMDHGMSGGPLVNEHGEIVGIIKSGVAINHSDAMRNDRATVVGIGTIRAFMATKNGSVALEAFPPPPTKEYTITSECKTGGCHSYWRIPKKNDKR